VVNLVSLSPLFKPKGGDERHFEVHLGGTENCLRAAEAHDVPKFVQMSGLGADPDGDTHFLRAKGEAERAVRDADVDWTIFRPSVVFGEGDEFVGFTKLLAPPYFTPLPGGGKTRFQPIWVGDLVEMLAMAIEGVAPEDEATAADASGEEATATDGGETDDEGTDDGADTGTDDAGDAAETDAADHDDTDGTAADAAEPVDPHVGQTYEVGGPEVLTLAEVARLAHAADNKPVSVLDVPMPLAGIGLSLLDVVPGAPMGSDQYRSLQFDNTTDHNDIGAFGFTEADLTTLADYLGVDPAVAGSDR
jgi:NADH dehydrogenase